MNQKQVEGGILNILHQNDLGYWFKKKTNEPGSINTMITVISALKNENLEVVIISDKHDFNCISLYAVAGNEPGKIFIYECEAKDSETNNFKEQHRSLLVVL